MLAWAWNLLVDETKWVGLVRGLLIGGGAGIATGEIPGVEGLPGWVGVLLAAFGGYIRSSTKGAEPKPGRLPR